jgi:hypothetical protein
MRLKIRLSLLSLAVFLFFFLPYATFVSRVTGHWQFSGLARENIISRQLDLAHPGRYMEVKKILSRLSEDKKRFRIQELVENFSLADYLTANRFVLIRSGLVSIVPRIQNFNQYFYGGLGFLFLGASCLRVPWDSRRKRSEFLLMAFVLPFFSHLFLVFNPRRFIPLLPIFLIGMGNGMNVWIQWIRDTFQIRRNQIPLAVSLTVFFLLFPSAWYLRRVLQYGDFPTDDKELGLWMKQHIPSIQEEAVASPTQFVNFYSGAKFLGLPYVEKFEDFLDYIAYKKTKYFVVSNDLEEPVRQSYQFLLDETKPPPPQMIRRYVLRGEKKKMILYEILR